MVSERTTPLRERMIEDMRIRGLGPQSQRAHIRAVKDFASFLGHPPGTATREDLRAYQLHMTDTEVTPSVYNARITALRFFFSMPPKTTARKTYLVP
ncbi:Phage integrase, N-terminal SAM-like domain [Aliiroseovarius crassostreae]|uniref:phage integrase N-terminal SAM-like domain-containing protein n=1 Tax=Aliiroseovarius crassostreae TaxID=154981 RepID=UPI0008E1F74F|nr:Phage integrase, N-terminal SAM-like domain [Aliiroseovarius crassostreae]